MREVVFKKVALKGGYSHNVTGFLKVDHVAHMIDFCQTSNRSCTNLDFAVFVKLLLNDKDVAKEILWARKQERKNPASVDFYQGVSGCRSWTLNIHEKGFEEVAYHPVAKFYVSAGNILDFSSTDRKGNWISGGLWSKDLLDILDSLYQDEYITNVHVPKDAVRYLEFHKQKNPGRHVTRNWV